MTAPIDWMSLGIAMASGAAVAGYFVVRTGGKGAAAPPPGGPSLDDLHARKHTLLEALRDAHDTRQVRGEGAVQDEIADLEAQAAEVLRDIATHSDAPGPPPPVEPSSGTTAAAARWQGALAGAAVVGFAAAVLFALQGGVRPRSDGMSVTGGDEDTLMRQAGRIPAPGEPGGGVPGVPENLQPRPSAALDAARARVFAAPNDVAARVQLGWALLEAEGWIDLYEVARQTLALEPGQPDALVQTAFVRMVMGQQDAALELVEQALSRAPTHVEALQAKGTILLRRGENTRAAEVFAQGLAAAGPGRGFEDLIAMAKAPGGAPTPTGGLQHPPVDGMATATPPSAQDRGVPVSGTISLGRSYEVPSGAVLFLVARPKGQMAGPPLASRRLPAGPFPMVFEIGPEHLMMGGSFPAEVTLTARIDLDGNAMSREEGAPLAAPLDAEAGRTDVDLVLR